jgi:hypothetical protein
VVKKLLTKATNGFNHHMKNNTLTKAKTPQPRLRWPREAHITQSLSSTRLAIVQAPGQQQKSLCALFTNPKSETKLFVKKMRLKAKRHEASKMPAQFFEQTLIVQHGEMRPVGGLVSLCGDRSRVPRQHKRSLQNQKEASPKQWLEGRRSTNR